MSFQWDSKYYQQANKELIEIGEDNSIVRTFSLDELKIFLKISQFELIEVIEKASYAFPTYVILAQKS